MRNRGSVPPLQGSEFNASEKDSFVSEQEDKEETSAESDMVKEGGTIAFFVDEGIAETVIKGALDKSDALSEEAWGMLFKSGDEEEDDDDKEVDEFDPRPKILDSKFSNCPIKLKLGETIWRLFLTNSYASSIRKRREAIIYAIQMVALREIPAWQWTNTRPLSFFTSSVNKKNTLKIFTQKSLFDNELKKWSLNLTVEKGKIVKRS